MSLLRYWRTVTMTQYLLPCASSCKLICIRCSLKKYRKADLTVLCVSTVSCSESRLLEKRMNELKGLPYGQVTMAAYYWWQQGASYLPLQNGSSGKVERSLNFRTNTSQKHFYVAWESVCSFLGDLTPHTLNQVHYSEIKSASVGKFTFSLLLKGRVELHKLSWRF